MIDREFRLNIALRVNFTAPQLAALSRIAARSGIGTSSFVRQQVLTSLKENPEWQVEYALAADEERSQRDDR